MRRIVCIMALIALLATPALAETAENPMMLATDALYEQIQARTAGVETEQMDFFEAGAWMSAVARTNDGVYTGWQGVVYDLDALALVAWEDAFTDAEAAAERVAAIAEAAQDHNAYSEHNATTPVPRDNFAVRDGQLFIYYPPEQLSYFSGRAGVISLYAYELDGLWRDGIPVTVGDVSQARAAMDAALEAGALPGALSAWTLGTAMDEADEALISVDTPNLTHEEAVWYFEAAEMRGAAFLSALDVDRIPSGTIDGIYTERIDFSGLCTGVATMAECYAALGEPEWTRAVETSDAYTLLPVGERAFWSNGNHAFTMHFVDGVLHSVILTRADIAR